MIEPIPGTKHGFALDIHTSDTELHAFLQSYPEPIRCCYICPEDLGAIFRPAKRVTVDRRVKSCQIYINHLS